jgi:hypothetical protein
MDHHSFIFPALLSPSSTLRAPAHLPCRNIWISDADRGEVRSGPVRA